MIIRSICNRKGPWSMYLTVGCQSCDRQKIKDNDTDVDRDARDAHAGFRRGDVRNGCRVAAKATNTSS
jgi:hypothetical protein